MTIMVVIPMTNNPITVIKISPLLKTTSQKLNASEPASGMNEDTSSLLIKNRKNRIVIRPGRLAQNHSDI